MGKIIVVIKGNIKWQGHPINKDSEVTVEAKNMRELSRTLKDIETFVK